jgi:DNA helicase-2/ATP-dependent DNA helicase PcrA
LVTNPTDELAFKRLVEMLPGVGGRGAEKLWQKFSAEFRASGFEPPEPSPEAIAAAWDPEGEFDDTQAAKPETAYPKIAPALQKCASAVPKKSVVAWAGFLATLSQLEAEPLRRNASGMIRHVIEAGYEDYVEETFANYRSRLEDLQQLASFALQFKSPEEFLTQLSLLTNIEAEDQQSSTKDDEQVRLEFDVVFVIMLCDGMFPSSRSIESVDGEEEERRLFYVAITRARNELYLSYPLIRMVASYGGDAMQQPSRFLKEFPPELVEEWQLKSSYHPYS